MRIFRERFKWVFVYTSQHILFLFFNHFCTVVWRLRQSMISRDLMARKLVRVTLPFSRPSQAFPLFERGVNSQLVFCVQIRSEHLPLEKVGVLISSQGLTWSCSQGLSWGQSFVISRFTFWVWCRLLSIFGLWTTKKKVNVQQIGPESGLF